MNRSLFALAALLLACAALAAPVPDPFKSGWGAPIDPDRDCKIRCDNGTLTIEMPGRDHDYDSSRDRFNAPRILRELEGDFVMQVRVRIDCSPSPQSTAKDRPSFVAGGFLVIPPESFPIRFFNMQYGVAGKGKAADGFATELSRDVKGGGYLYGVYDKRWRKWPFKAKPEHVYLRLEREDDLLLYKISPEQKEWMTIGGGTILGLPHTIKVGLGAYTTSTESSKVRFDQLRLSLGKRKAQRGGEDTHHAGQPVKGPK